MKGLTFLEILQASLHGVFRTYKDRLRNELGDQERENHERSFV